MRKQLLFLLLIPALAITAGAVKVSHPNFHKKLAKDKRIVHALNRLTFGPRPGDDAEVARVGLTRWIDLQLHPERIPENPALEAKLKPLETLTMNSRTLMMNYPPPQVILAAANSGRTNLLPQDPVIRARYERMIKQYKNRGKERDRSSRPNLGTVLSPEQLRTMRGGTPAQRFELLNALPEAKLYEAIDALPFAMRGQILSTGPVELRRKVLAAQQPLAVISFDLNESKLQRAIYSNRQLEEVLVDFWFNHFNVFMDKGNDRFLTTSYERDAIRPHVLGHFKDLVVATAQHPAMLFYLDNFQSSGPQPSGARPGFGQRAARGLNENYGRELLELHTLGVDGGYTQKDVTEVARCFTGWTIADLFRGGGFSFNERMHDKGEKTVLGHKVPAGGGMDEGMKVIDILVHHPSTARFISKKLAMRFVADEPSPSLIDKMAKTFQQTDGDIRAVLKTMFDSREFFSEGAWRAKMKSPLEMVVSAVRATGADVQTASVLTQQLQQLGQPIYRKVEPTGYSTNSEEWTNSAALLARMNFAIALTGNRVPGIKVDAARLERAGDPMSIARSLLFTDLSSKTREVVAKETTSVKAAALVLGGPEFQRR